MFAGLERFANSETVETSRCCDFPESQIFHWARSFGISGSFRSPLVAKLDRSVEVASRGRFSRGVNHISVIAPSTIVGRNSVPAAVVELGSLHEPCCQCSGPVATLAHQRPSRRAR